MISNVIKTKMRKYFCLKYLSILINDYNFYYFLSRMYRIIVPLLEKKKEGKEAKPCIWLWLILEFDSKMTSIIVKNSLNLSKFLGIRISFTKGISSLKDLNLYYDKFLFINMPNIADIKVLTWIINLFLLLIKIFFYVKLILNIFLYI